MLNFLFDLPNFLVILLFLFLCYVVKLVPSWLALTLGVLSASPFFINDVIFPATYMPDQFRYLNVVQHLRSFDLNHGEFTTVKWAGWMLTFFPLPLVETIKSLGFFNRFAVSALIVWLYAYKNIRGWPIVFMLFYPSFILYTSVSLRDALIVCLMISAVFTYIDRKIFLFVIWFCLLYLTKFQNAFFLLVFIFLHEGLSDIRKNYIRSLFLLGAALSIVYYFQSALIDKINVYRLAMFIEDGGNPVDLNQFLTLFDLAFGSLKFAINFHLKPLPWQAENAFQIVQSIENILLFAILLILYVNAFKRNFMIFIKYFIFLILSFAVYESVVFNYGTAARYKFPFITIVVLGVYYELKYKKGGR